MAAIGMRHLVFAPFAENQTEGELPTYGSGMKLGRAVSSNVTLQRNESELYADDVLAESDDSITGGTVDMVVAEILDEVGAVAFGSKKDADTEEYSDSDTASPYIGMGYMREMKYQGKSTFKATWFYKVQLNAAEDVAQTKGENVSFQTQRVTGKLLGVAMADGTTKFRAWKTFNTAAEATAWLNTKANYAVA